MELRLNTSLIELFLLFQVFNFLIFFVEYNFFSKMVSTATLRQKTKLICFLCFPSFTALSLIINPIYY